MLDQTLTEAPKITFAELNLDPRIQTAIDAAGYDHPTPIQEQAIPVIKKGGDQKYEEPKGENAPQKLFKVHYRGTLIDGTEFDASPEGEPIPMTLQVVPGFREALTTMPVGAKWKLFLSPELAYGERRASAQIEPNSTLIFELELVAIEDAPQRPQLPFQIPGQ